MMNTCLSLVSALVCAPVAIYNKKEKKKKKKICIIMWNISLTNLLSSPNLQL